MSVTVVYGKFEWDQEKEESNVRDHGVHFKLAALAFADPKRLIAHDDAHSKEEPRFFCIGEVEGKVLTVRFTLRGKQVRIIGAGYWRKGKRFYAQENAKG